MMFRGFEIRELEKPIGVDLSAMIARAHDEVTAAVKSSVRVDLLFAAISPTASNTNAVRDQAREAIHAIEQDDPNLARRHHLDASLSQSYLVNVAGEAIQSTGTRRDIARKFKGVRKLPDADPKNRAPLGTASAAPTSAPTQPPP